MRILWLSTNSGLFATNNPQTPYNGGGWISSLQQVFASCKDHKLALAFICNQPLKKTEQNGTVYYPIYEPAKSPFKKIKEYYGGYKRWDKQKHVQESHAVIKDFKPDAIHLFGMENPMASILGNTPIPIAVHLQGLLAPSNNAFFPVGFNKSSFLFPFSINEWVLRNGYIYAKNSIHARGEREVELFKRVKYAMGRTQWDYQVSQLLAPQSRYFHVDEVLREPFYKNAGKWHWLNDDQLIIVSTISNTIYKGLDTILKTAKLLKEETSLNFRWLVVGIKREDKITRFFEHKLKINGSTVDVEYKGVLNAQELCEILLNSHLYVHPSYIDNSPNSICEAQLLGVPVIGTYVGGISSLVTHESTGWLVPANAPFELAYRINWCYKNKNICKSISENSYQAAALRHDKNQILRDLINIYLKITNEQK